MNIQELLNTMNRAGRRERGHYHVTLGGLIAALGGADPFAVVVFDGSVEGPCEPHSYRGYYSDLALESGPDVVAKDLLRLLTVECLEQTFEGYKGGDYDMGADTPLWRACYGECGDAIVGVSVKPDRVTLLTKRME